MKEEKGVRNGKNRIRERGTEKNGGGRCFGKEERIRKI